MLGHTLLHRPQSLLARRLLFQIHLWVGIGVGAYMFLMAVTGSALVFREELEQRSHRSFYPPPSGVQAPISDVIRNIQAAYPEHRVSSVHSPAGGRPVYQAFIEKDRQFRTVLVSSSGTVLGERPDTGFIRWLQDLHVNLLAGTTGRFVNGIGALLLLLLCVTGAFIWWPGLEAWRGGVRVDVRKNWRRVVWELHGATGFWNVLVIGMWAVTGAYFSFPQPFQSVVNRLSPLTSATARPSDAAPGRRPLDVHVVIARAQELLPGGRIAAVILPATDRGAVVVQVSRAQRDRLDDTGDLHFTFDQYSGALLSTWDRRSRSIGDAVLSWIVPLHFGHFGGLATRVLWVLLGLSPSLLFATSAVMWWNRVLRKKWNQLKAD